MGQTIYNVPRSVQTYARAKEIHDQIKPIRNLVPERRPLGARRDHHKYSVRMSEAQPGSVEFIVYQTPVLTYHTDGSIDIRNGGYSSQTTHEFISWVLGVQANGWMGKTKLSYKGEVYVMGQNEVLPLVVDPDRGLVFGRKQEQYGYRMNRKAANKVRTRYKEFTDYLINFTKLRAESRAFGYQGRETREVVVLQVKELVDVVGVTERKPHHELTLQFNYLGLPYGRGWDHPRIRHNRPGQEAEFLKLIAPDQPQDDKHMNFYKAAMLLVVGERGMYFTPESIETLKAGGTLANVLGQQFNEVVRPPADAIAFYDDALLMANAQEVLELTKLEQGKMPNRKYVGWINEGVAK